jgi:hypothetical protein
LQRETLNLNDDGTTRTIKRLFSTTKEGTAFHYSIRCGMVFDTDSSPYEHHDRTEKSLYILLFCGIVPISMDDVEGAQH